MVIANVTDGETIATPWGNSVADAINAMTAGLAASVPVRDWSTAPPNAAATSMAAAIGGAGGGTNWGAANASGWISKANGVVTAAMRVTAVAPVAAGTGNFRLNLPYPAGRFAAGTPLEVGEGFWMD